MQKRDEMKRLKREYMEKPKQAGIFRITNTVNGKVLLGSSLNLHGPLNKHEFMLTIGSHINNRLQKDWNSFGADAFTFEILEVVEKKDDPAFNVEEELELLEEIWIEKERPFTERGYNEGGKIRE